MRVFRLLLCILILFCGAVIGLHLSQRLIRRKDVLTGFEVLFHRAMIQIEYYAGNLCEVFSDNFANQQFSHELPFDIQWRRWIEGLSYHLSKDDIRMLLSFTDGLGSADANAQKRHIALYCELLKEHIAAAQEEIRMKSKMVRIIPLSLGMLISLLVI